MSGICDCDNCIAICKHPPKNTKHSCIKNKCYIKHRPVKCSKCDTVFTNKRGFWCCCGDYQKQCQICNNHFKPNCIRDECCITCLNGGKKEIEKTIIYKYSKKCPGCSTTIKTNDPYQQYCGKCKWLCDNCEELFAHKYNDNICSDCKCKNCQNKHMTELLCKNCPRVRVESYIQKKKKLPQLEDMDIARLHLTKMMGMWDKLNNQRILAIIEGVKDLLMKKHKYV